MKEYIEREKVIARNEAISFAVKSLTKNRQKSTIARKSYVHDIRDYLLKNGTPNDKEFASILKDNEVYHWETFYESIIGRRKPSELKVAYLSGPNPENDLEVLVNNGILPENVWAFESDNQIYNQAVMSALESKYPFIKIFKGKIENYLKLFPFRFDIIYLDFCKTLVSSAKTLSVVRDVFYYQKLNSPGIIITNFALPEKSPLNQEQRENLNLLAANYLFPKSFTEKYTGLGGSFIESADCCGIEKDEFIQIAKRNENTFYSQLITRVLFDLPSVIIPYQRFNSDENLINLFFKNYNTNSFYKDYHEDLITFPNDHSLIWGMSNFIIEKESFYEFLSKFNKQLALNGIEEKLLESIELVSYFITERSDIGIHSEKLDRIRKNWKITDKYIFCDVFLFHQLKDILIGQLTNPYFYNVEFTRRWMYKAKKTEMFMDLIVYDECRYIFDWMPTLDMFEEGVKDINRQLSLRFAMDSISKQSRWYNDEFFSGTSVVDQGAKTFEAKELRKRVKIK